MNKLSIAHGWNPMQLEARYFFTFASSLRMKELSPWRSYEPSKNTYKLMIQSVFDTGMSSLDFTNFANWFCFICTFVKTQLWMFKECLVVDLLYAACFLVLRFNRWPRPHCLNLKLCLGKEGWLDIGGTTPVENGRRFLTPFFVRVAHLQGERQPFLGSNEAEILRTYPSKLPFIL